MWESRAGGLWAMELQSLNPGYKWKKIFERFSSEVAEKQRHLDML